MKKITILIVISVLFISKLTAQKQIFSVPNFEDSLKKHKTVAILPIKVTLLYKRLPKGFDAETNKAEEKKTGFNMQQGMYTYLT